MYYLLLGLIWSFAAFGFPTSFDLRNVSGQNLVTGVQNQSGGTCWTFGTMAAVEGNLAMTGAWAGASETGEPNLAEYHLDWWNGFNKNSNSDVPNSSGLTVHQGGDYRVASAYLTRGAGAVRAVDGNSYSNTPKITDPSYHFYYPRNIDWLAYDTSTSVENKIKQALSHYGVVGTALAWSDSFYSSNVFYQPKSSSSEANHAVAIVGWDDTKKTKASTPGAWIVKNSWGSSWGDKGYFWIAYPDKVAGTHPDMGAVSIYNVEPMKYKTIYYHDFHGWRDTKTGVEEAFNAFQVVGNEKIEAVSFFTSADQVEYTIKVYTKFENGELSEEISTQDGWAEVTGFRTVNLNWPVSLAAGQKFYVYVRFSKGGHPFDKTSDVPVLLCGPKTRVIVKSAAKAGESFYRKAGKWVDLTVDDPSANFCIKALSNPAQ